MEQGKTIKEIAEELGVSKTAVRKQIANLELQTSLRKIGNQFAIEKEQEAAQALHAGMIQQQLKSGEAAPAEPETPDKGKRKRWWKW